MMKYAICDIKYNVSRKRYTVKVLALFQNREDADAFRFSVPSLKSKPADVVDVTTGKILSEHDTSVEHFINMRMPYDEAYRMHLVCVNREYNVKEYFKGWRKRNGFEINDKQ